MEDNMMHMGHDNMRHMVMSHNNEGSGHMMMHMGNLKRKFWVSLSVSIPILLFSPMMGMHLPFQITFPGSQWVVLILASFLFFYGGYPFLSGAKMELKSKSPAMMTLIAMGISVSYVYSLYAFISTQFLHETGKMDFFWELATLIVIMLLGHWIEMRAVGDAGNALKKMAELLPGSAHVVRVDGQIDDIPLQELKVGEKVLVKPGEKLPADGKVVSGETTVNESMVTGESRDISKSVGMKVIGGSVNGNGAIEVEVTGTGETGYLAQVMKLVSSAQKEKSKAETMSDKVAKALFYVALVTGVLAFIVWLLIDKNINIALERMVTVFIIACPHALGLAIPLVIARSTSIGATHGLLIRNRNILEKAKKVNVVAMDKTGTLTQGNFTLSMVKSFSEKWSDHEVLGIMAALETHSNHPLAISILDEAKKKGLLIPLAENVNLIPGMGLSGMVDKKDVKIVTSVYLDQHNIIYDKDLFNRLANEGNSVSYLLVGDKPVGLIAQGDQIKPEARQTINELIREHIVPVMLTGDNKVFASVVAKQLGIHAVYASLLPEDKEKVITNLQQKGEIVMMVGDGVNDAPALARADIGVAIGAGTDVAIDSAEVVLVQSNPYDIIHLLTLAKRTMSKMIQNLWWGAGYNIIAIPLAAGVLAPLGIILTPAIGAVLMSFSTVVVALNALSLKMDK